MCHLICVYSILCGRNHLYLPQKNIFRIYISSHNLVSRECDIYSRRCNSVILNSHPVTMLSDVDTIVNHAIHIIWIQLVCMTFFRLGFSIDIFWTLFYIQQPHMPPKTIKVGFLSLVLSPYCCIFYSSNSKEHMYESQVFWQKVLGSEEKKYSCTAKIINAMSGGRSTGLYRKTIRLRH